MVILAVERERLVVELQRDGGYTDVVLRSTETDSQRVVSFTATDTAYKIDQRGVGKVVDHFTIEVERALMGETSAIGQAVTIELGFDVVLANRDR